MSTTADAAAELEALGLSRMVFSEEEIARRVQAMGRSITRFYREETSASPERPPGDSAADSAEELGRSRVPAGSADLLVLAVLKGSFIFVADLVRAIDLPLQVEFMVASSYGSSTTSSGTVELLYEPEMSLKERSVLLLEDIVDSGTTLERLVPMLEERGPKSLEVCALLEKARDEDAQERGSGRGNDGAGEPRWVGFDAPDAFLVGYGLDYSEHFRHLPYIASLQEPVPSDHQ